MVMANLRVTRKKGKEKGLCHPSPGSEISTMFLGVWVKINRALWRHENGILSTCLSLKLELPETHKSGTSVRPGV